MTPGHNETMINKIFVLYADICREKGCIGQQESSAQLMQEVARGNTSVGASDPEKCEKQLCPQLSCTNAAELLFSGHQRELHGFGNKAL